jgi:hypothetical protein
MNVISFLRTLSNNGTTNSKQPRLSPIADFHSHHYLKHNQRRQEHLSTLGLNLVGKTVLEVGAGIGDHSTFFLDRQCLVTITEARQCNIDLLRQRYPAERVLYLDLDKPPSDFGEVFEIVYCYGTLYHLARPAEALKFMASLCTELLLLETCVASDEMGSINPVAEDPDSPSQAISGTGCRPSRQWVFAELKKLFPNAYIPITQPWHEEFPLNWNALGSTPAQNNKLTRAIFIASRAELKNHQLVDNIPTEQIRC